MVVVMQELLNGILQFLYFTVDKEAKFKDDEPTNKRRMREKFNNDFFI